MTLLRRIKAGFALVSLLALPGLLQAQTPTITIIKSGFGAATNGSAITAGTPSPGGCDGSPLCLNLFITGNFDPEDFQESVTWTENGIVTGLQIDGATSTQIVANVPMMLYQSAGNATITVTETQFECEDNCTTSTTATYTVNPPMASIGALPSGIVRNAYSTAYFTGGTGTFTAQLLANPDPPGLSSNSPPLLAGTPQQSGTFPVNPTVTDSWGNVLTVNDSIVILGRLAITPTSLPNGRAQLAYTATVAAAGGVTPYNWSATGLPTGLSIASATGVISGTTASSGTFPVTVSVSDSGGQSTQATLSLQIIPVLTITTAGLPAGTVSQTYGAAVSATGGVTPYTFSATGLPGGLSINSASGAISGVPTNSGTSSVTVRVTDSGGQLGQSAQANYSITINAPSTPPLQITTLSLPGGTANQIYAAAIGATGGTGSYAFSISAGSLPPAVQLATVGQLYGTATTPGTYNFTVQVSDSLNNTATHGYTVIIAPAQLTVTGAPPASIAVNSTLSVPFGASGGVAPYKLVFSGNAPSGTSFANGVLSGVASAPGTFGFTITATDSQLPPATASQSYSITVTPGPLTISASLPGGTVGQAYSGQFSASGGTGGYTWTGSGNNGLSVSSSGAVSGTPTSAGSASISVTVTDSSGTKASGSFTVAIAGPTLTITTTSLPAGALTTSYSATLAATGGTTPYTWSAAGLPDGLSISSSGAISGTPTAQGAFTVNVTVTDQTSAKATASLSLTINTAPVKITTNTITPPVINSSFSVSFSATGGTPPYTWTATNLPNGVTMAPNGTLSGTPTSTGTFTITVTVTDANGQQSTQNVNLVVTLPAAPGTSLNGFPANGSPAAQVTSAVTFNAPYPVDVTVNLKLTFAPSSGADDPNVQFATGGRTTSVTVPAGSTTSLATIGVQTGTVAGVITITEQLMAEGSDITPSPAPTRTITIGAAAPTVTSVTVTPGTSGFTVVVVGFDPTRAITQVNFTFTPAAGSTLQTSTVTIPAQTLFSAWYQSAASAAFGSQFSFTITFTVSGSVSSIASVSVTAVNPTGTSAGVSAPV